MIGVSSVADLAEAALVGVLLIGFSRRLVGCLSRSLVGSLASGHVLGVADGRHRELRQVK